MGRLTVGDSVMWAGSWGSEPPRLVQVTGIQINEANGSKSGQATDSVSWHLVEERRVIVDIDLGINRNGPIPGGGHWAWGFQIKPAPQLKVDCPEEAN